MRLFKIVGLSILGFIVALLLIAFTVGFVKGVWESFNEPVATSKPVIKQDTEVQLESDNYETVLAGAKDIFVDGCTGEGSTSSECVCMYNWLDDNLTNTEFGQVIAESVQGKIPDSLWKAAQACVAK